MTSILEVNIQHITENHLFQVQELLIKGAQETNFVLANKEFISDVNKFKPIVSKWSESPYEFNLGAFIKDDQSSNEKLIGHIHCRISMPHLDRVKHICNFNMLVLKNYWGNGIGQRLIQAMILKAKEMNIKRIEACVLATNERAINFYKKCNFNIEGIRRSSYFNEDHYE